jgi:8-oxo-dGTP diphosphatase
MSEIQPQRPYVGAHLVLIRDSKVLLMKRTVKDSMEGMYAFVAGKVDQFESPREALAREAFEEVGLKVAANDLEHILTVHHAKSDYKADKADVIEFYFTARKWEGEPQNLEPHKVSELGFFPLDNLPQPLPDGLKFAISALNGGSNFIEN